VPRLKERLGYTNLVAEKDGENLRIEIEHRQRTG